ncbi:MAG: NUDIX domain-containing protein [Solobacterium sp.]|nr:NUDIX domain-containing protein [Solobacterium sp.]
MDYIRELRQLVGHRRIILNCAGVLIEKDDKILFQRRSDNGCWGLVGGLLEQEETYAQAAVREAEEETGLQVELTSFLGIYHNYQMVWPNGDAAHTLGAYFTARVKAGTVRVDEESLELRWFAEDERPALFAEDHRAALAAYDRGVRLALPMENFPGQY